MEFRPKRVQGTLVGCSFTLALGTAAAVLGQDLSRRSPSLATLGLSLLAFSLLLLALLFAFWSYGCWSLRYSLDRNRLVIRWANSQHVIPLGAITGLVWGQKEGPRMGFRTIRWFGYRVGRGKVKGVGETLFYTSPRSSRELLYILTPGLAYAISVANPKQFALEVKLRRRLGSMEMVSHENRRWPFDSLSFWQDPWARKISVAGLLMNLFLLAYVFYVYPSLPPLLSLPSTSAVGVEQLGSQREMLHLPLVALLLWGANQLLGFWLHPKERLAAYLCLLANLLIPVLLLATIRGIT
ncbi:MAG: hypothetical protein HY664_03415 [Chloroflexi bacterium]|nr:hypothetical protein [Chloroflexota bacterium]